MARKFREDQFLALLEQNRKILFKVANLYCRSGADFQDVVQEIVLQAWRSFDRYDDSRRFSTWLYRIALNVGISFYRAESRRSRSLVAVDESILEIAVPPSQAAELDDHFHLLRAYIDRLTDLDKGLMLLYLDGTPYEVIGEIVGISESNVGTKINRIKQKLQQTWTDSLNKEHSHGFR